MRLLISLLALELVLPCCVVAAEVDLSAPVRVLGAAPPAQSRDISAGRDRSAPPTITRGLLPQYQSVPTFRSDVTAAPGPGESTMRFLVALPNHLLLLQASVMIDGEPFENIREQRIDRLLAELKKSVREAPDAASSESPATESANSAESPLTSEPTQPEGEPADEERDASESENNEEIDLLARPSSALEARLRRYAAVTGRTPSRDEIRWLLTKWVDGPTLLLLDENFQRFRAAQAPAFHVFDRDMDGNVSAAELDVAQETILSCDTNQNDVVEYAEIAEVAKDPRRKSRAATAHALIPILEATLVAKAFRRIAKRFVSPQSTERFDENSDGELDAAEITRLDELEPDVTVVVSFDTRDAAKSTTKIVQVSSAFDSELSRKVGSSITFPLGATMLEFSAVQSPALAGSDQISVGIVDDGYPLLPALDPNEDGRLTIRELRKVQEPLRRFDANKDGEISQEEIPSTVRLSFGLGPSVHQHLADIRSIHPPSTAPQITAPPWFTRMDANRDGDISQREALLKRDKFRQLDADNDGLISPKEAIDVTGINPKRAKETTESIPKKATASP